MSQPPNLQIYPSSKTFIEAIFPFAVGTTREWSVNLSLGFAYDFVAQNWDDHGINYYATTTTSEGTLQLLLSRCARRPLVIMSAMADLADLVKVDEQLELLADWLAQQDEAFMKSKYFMVQGRPELSSKLIHLISEKLGWLTRKLPRQLLSLREGVVDPSTFVLHTPTAKDDVIRLITLSDDLHRLTELYEQFRKDTGDSDIFPSQNALKHVTSYVAGGIFWGYWVFSDSGPPQLVAAAEMRRTTPNVVGVSLVVTAQDFRKRGYGAAITSALVNHAFKSVDEGGLGKKQVTLFYDESKGTEKMYKRIGFVDGERCNLWVFQKP
ncbi:hypothetical protein DL96DRAFT_1557181 [Flagelloscypha sp. PMI_526]|nr:hypothetical protein DL96DRAFT_1557181 [Flagelloscypha sp. PMI_526]